MLYLADIAVTRRSTGYNPRFVWEPTRGMTPTDMATLRNRYRALRRAGIQRMYARWIIWDLVDVGTRAKRDNEGLLR